MELKKLNPKALKLWYIYSVIWALFILGLYATAVFFAGELRVIIASVLGVIALLLLVLVFLLPSLKFKRYGYAYNRDKITVQRGVIFRHKVVIPVCQIQDLHKVEGPIMLLLKLAGVEISTAGSNFTLAYLSSSDADEMIDALEENLRGKCDETVL